MKRICLLIPSLAHGGAERVMSLIANSLSDEFNLEVHLILYTKGTLYYEISDNVILHLPEFDFRKYPFVIQAYKVFVFLRKTLIKIKVKIQYHLLLPYSLFLFRKNYAATCLE